MRTLAVVLTVAICWIASTATATHACTPTAANLVFAAYNPVTGSAVDASSTISVTCPVVLPNTQYNFCVSIESGSGFTGNQRQLVSGVNRMNYGLFTNAARTNDWGSYRTGYGVTGVGFQTTLTTGPAATFNFSLPYYGRIASGQNTLPPAANYLSTFNNPAGPANYRPSVRWATVASGLTCATMINQAIGAANFTVRSSIALNCAVSASTLNFGSTLTLAANVDATSTINVTCTNTTPYTIGLDAGLGVGATLANRRMTLSGNTINYSMFTNAARTTNWGAATVGGTGTGSSQPFTVFGRVFGAQPLPNPGTYADTITTTVTF